MTKLLDFKNSEAGDLADKSRYVSPTELADIYCDFIKNYPICSIEDPFDQDDWEGYVHFTERVGKDTQVVGDDLLVTNPTRIQTGIKYIVVFFPTTLKVSTLFLSRAAFPD